MTLITKEKENSYNWTLSGFDEFPNTEIQSFDDQAIYQLQWNTAVRELALQFKATESNDIANLYGVILEKTVFGLLYHSVGVNGATFGKTLQDRRFLCPNPAAESRPDRDLFGNERCSGTLSE